MAATSATSSLLSSSILAAPRQAMSATVHRSVGLKRKPVKARVCCEAASTSTADLSSDVAAAAAEIAKVGARVRVKASVKVFHVQKAPDLELQGLEGVIKQYVGLFKGQSISANLPFKVEFNFPDGIDGRPGPIKFLAHLREDELEFLS
ncbi:ferredoxin-thioredoxin reductase, variable chain-like [Wolffia australiana]